MFIKQYNPDILYLDILDIQLSVGYKLSSNEMKRYDDPESTRTIGLPCFKRVLFMTAKDTRLLYEDTRGEKCLLMDLSHILSTA